MAAGIWDEAASEKLKALKKQKSPSASQKAEIARLLELKSNRPKPDSTTETPVDPAPQYTPAPVPAMDPNLKASMDANIETTDRLRNKFESQGDFNPQNLPEIPGVKDGFSADRQRVEDSIVQNFDRRMQPQFQKEEAALRQRLAAEGVPEGSEQERRAIENLRRTQGDQRMDAIDRSIQTSGAEQSRMFNLASGARNQLHDEQLQRYKLPGERLTIMQPLNSQAASLSDTQAGRQFEASTRQADARFDAAGKERAFEQQKELGEKEYQYQRQLKSLDFNLAQRLKATKSGGSLGGRRRVTKVKGPSQSDIMFDEMVNSAAPADTSGNNSNKFNAGLAAGSQTALGAGLKK